MEHTHTKRKRWGEVSKLWKSEEEKLIKSGRKWAECDYIPYRYAELF